MRLFALQLCKNHKKCTKKITCNLFIPQILIENLLFASGNVAGTAIAQGYDENKPEQSDREW